MLAIKNLDLVLLVVALPVFLLAGLPMLGYAAGAAVWLAQRGIQVALNRRAAASEDPRADVGLTAGSMIGRGWLVALTIFGVGLSDNDAGLSAAVLVIALFTAYFTVHDPAPLRAARRSALVSRRLIGASRRSRCSWGRPAGALGMTTTRTTSRRTSSSSTRGSRRSARSMFNKAVLYLFLAAALTCATMVYVARRMQQRPNRVQTAVEFAYPLMRDNITRGNMDDRMAAKWFPFIGTLFLFIWFSNIIGYIPLPTNTEHKVDIFGLHVPSLAIYAATANLSVPLVLTLIVWLSYHVEGIRAKGFLRYLKSWIPAGVEGPARIPIFFIEVISHFVPRRQPERPTLRQHPRRPPAHPVHGRGPGRAAEPGRRGSVILGRSRRSRSPSSSSRSAWSPPCRPSSSPP